MNCLNDFISIIKIELYLAGKAPGNIRGWHPDEHFDRSAKDIIKISLDQVNEITDVTAGSIVIK